MFATRHRLSLKKSTLLLSGDRGGREAERTAGMMDFCVGGADIIMWRAAVDVSPAAVCVQLVKRSHKAACNVAIRRAE